MFKRISSAPRLECGNVMQMFRNHDVAHALDERKFPSLCDSERKISNMVFVILNRARWVLTILLCLVGFGVEAAERERISRIFLVGDSTVQNKTSGFQGWGTPFTKWVDPKQFVVDNRAGGGRSSRSYLRERWWDAVLKELQ